MSNRNHLLGPLLRKRRTELGIGLRELAGRVDISPTFISRVETQQEPRPPSSACLTALAKELDLDPDDLLAAAGRVPDDVASALVSDVDLVRAVRAIVAGKIAGAEVLAWAKRRGKRANV